jgi:hypothetical protein
MTTDKFIKVEDIEKRKTLGQQLADTEHLHQKQQIEVGEFVEEVGNKEVMKEIWKQIDERRQLPQWKEKFYIFVWFKKSAVLHRLIEVFVHCRHTKPNPEPGLTLFSYEPAKDLLLLEWVLPDKHAFKTFIKTREYSDPFLMECVDKYLNGSLR